MIVVVEFEVETEDYGGKEFKVEIERLLADIDTKIKLLRFKMHEKDGINSIDWRAIDWKAK